MMVYKLLHMHCLHIKIAAMCYHDPPSMSLNTFTCTTPSSSGSKSHDSIVTRGLILTSPSFARNRSDALSNPFLSQ
eukprot:m.9139 g.9139  ORF g.9139 m.9139 type:complete len:76 (+) comp4013_c0_seq1:31-258(+)